MDINPDSWVQAQAILAKTTTENILLLTSFNIPELDCSFQELRELLATKQGQDRVALVLKVREFQATHSFSHSSNNPISTSSTNESGTFIDDNFSKKWRNEEGEKFMFQMLPMSLIMLQNLVYFDKQLIQNKFNSSFMVSN